MRDAVSPEAVFGTTITFITIAWIAILLRLYVRFSPPKLAGWDDLFVVLAGLCALAGSIITCLLPDAGMGKHIYTLSLSQLTHFHKYVFSSNLNYAASTTFIKLAILLQYMRLLSSKPVARRVIIFLITLVSLWGLTFFFLIMFSCRPIRKFWNPMMKGKCILFGVKLASEGNQLYGSFAAHAGSNMLLDIVILLVPLPFLRGLRSLTGKTRAGLWGVFVLGAIVVILSIIRIVAITTSKLGTRPVFDPTYAASPILLFSVLEVNVAILVASIPIFWPLVTSLASDKILVVNEIEVRSSSRSGSIDEFGLGNGTNGRFPYGKEPSGFAGKGMGFVPEGKSGVVVEAGHPVVVEITSGGEYDKEKDSSGNGGGRSSRLSGMLALHKTRTRTPSRSRSRSRSPSRSRTPDIATSSPSSSSKASSSPEAKRHPPAAANLLHKPRRTLSKLHRSLEKPLPAYPAPTSAPTSHPSSRSRNHHHHHHRHHSSASSSRHHHHPRHETAPIELELGRRFSQESERRLRGKDSGASSLLGLGESYTSTTGLLGHGVSGSASAGSAGSSPDLQFPRGKGKWERL